MKQPKACALYLRSSKDRHEVSLEAQRRQLTELAAERGLPIAQEYEDAVESGKDDDRAGFQRLLHDLKRKDRPWSTLLTLDTSRIARRRHLAVIFEHEAAKAGVDILYKSVPDADPITGMLLRSILQAMDEWHSLTSRAKGVAGQQENIRRGWRAGGPAPRGYALEHTPTGGIRDGAPVTKSRLVPNDDAPAVARYLKARSSGKSRAIALALAGAHWPTSGLHDLEWHALTYAGHTVWGQSSETRRRRPRNEWTIQRDTHPALITDTEAESILSQLERRAGRRTRATDRPYLLTGLLIAPDGTPWAGEWDSKTNGPMYRLNKGPRVSGRRIEHAVLDTVLRDLTDERTVAYIAVAMRKLADPGETGQTLRRLTQQIDELTRQIARLVELAIDVEDPAPYRRAIAEKERTRHALVAERNETQAAATRAAEARKWTEADVRRLLTLQRGILESALESGNVGGLKISLYQLIERVEYAPGSNGYRIAYRLDTGVNLALPRVDHANPVSWERFGTLPRRMTRA